MSRIKEVTRFMRDLTPTVTNDLTRIDLTGIGAGDTFTLTPTRVDTATAGTATGAIAYDASVTVQASNMQTAVRALGGIYADATVASAGGVLHDITVRGGYNVTWALTPTGFAGGATVETTAGSISYAGEMPIGKYGIVKRIRAAGFADNSVNLSLVDEDATNCFVKTAIDMFNAGADLPYDKYLTADGVAGEDGAAAANVTSGLFVGALTATFVAQAPKPDAYVALFVDTGRGGRGLLRRSSGTFTGTTATIHLNVPYAIVKRLHLHAVSDATINPVITDDYGKNVYTKTDTDYTTAANVQLSHEGVDQAANAVADLLDVVVRSPLSISVTNHDGTGFEVIAYVEG